LDFLTECEFKFLSYLLALKISSEKDVSKKIALAILWLWFFPTIVNASDSSFIEKIDLHFTFKNRDFIGFSDRLLGELALAEEKIEIQLEELERKFKAHQDRYFQKLKEIESANQEQQKISQYFHDGVASIEALAIKDEFLSGMIPKQLYHGKVAFLAIGNAFSKYDSSPRQLIELLIRIREQNIFIVYDADSKASDIIETYIPEKFRVGISGNIGPVKSKRGTIFHIHNPYLRMQVILGFKDIIITYDSLVGAAVLIEHSRRDYRYYILGDDIYEPLPRWSRYLDKSCKKIISKQEFNYQEEKEIVSKKSVSKRAMKHKKANLKKDLLTKNLYEISETCIKFENLGIKYSSSENIEVFSDPVFLVDELLTNFPYEVKKLDVPDIDSILGNMTSEEIQALVKEPESYVKKVIEMNQSLEGGGVVLFGSGRGSEYFEPLVAGCIKKAARLAMPIYTGGEGGFMAVANRMAIKQGAYSVGIVIDHGRNKYTDPSLHSKVISTDGYWERIPLLLHDRELIIFAPGGSGTMKELATTLIMMSAYKKFGTPLIFLSEEYYEGLINWFRNLNLPKEFMDNIKIINSASAMKRFLNSIEKNL
jgi:predicted Rossmann-fold nucleotide-binding protein